MSGTSQFPITKVIGHRYVNTMDNHLIVCRYKVSQWFGLVRRRIFAGFTPFADGSQIHQ